MPTAHALAAAFIQVIHESLTAAALAQVHTGTELDLFTDPNALMEEAYERTTGHPINYSSTDEPLNQLLQQAFTLAKQANYQPTKHPTH